MISRLKRKFRLKTILLFLILFTEMLVCQEEKTFFTITKEKTTAIILTVPPASDQGFVVYRKGTLPADEYIPLNGNTPVKPFLDADEAASYLSVEWAEITEQLETEDAFDVLRKIRSGQFTGMLLSLLYPKVAVVSGRWFVDSTATVGKEYSYKIVYIDDYLRVKDSIEKKVLIKEYVPKTPTNTEIKIGDAQALVTWKYPVWQGDYADLAFRFYVYRKAGNGKFERVNKREILRDDKNPLEFTDIFLQNGEEYSYQITAVDPIGNESKPSPVVKAKPKDDVPPEMPSGLSVRPEDGYVLLSWFMNTEADASGYNVYRVEGSEKNTKKLNKNILQLTNTSFTDSTAGTGIQYFYSISCIDKSGNESRKCNPVAAIGEDKTKPLPPADITWKFEKLFLRLNWKPSKSNDVVGYFVYGGYGDLITRLNSEPLRTTAFTDSGYEKKGLMPGKLYSVRITAVDKGFNESAQLIKDSIPVPDSDPPLPPQNISAMISEEQYIEVTVNPSVSSDAEKYLLYRVAGKKDKLLSEYSEMPVLYIDKDINIGTEYFYYAVATDKSGNKSEKAISNTIRFRDFSPPAAPVNIKATLVKGKVELSWNEVIDNQLAGYYVYRCTTPTGVYEKLTAQPIKKNSYTDENGTKNYFYKITSADLSGNESPISEYFVPR